MVAWVVEALGAAGHRPAVAMRGYGARRGERSDEEAEYAERLPGVPVAAHPDRHSAIARLFAARGDVDCVVLDDGFQHRRIHRDLDLVLVDAAAGTLRDRLLPAGHLREPPAALRRADAVVMTHADGVDAALAMAVSRCHGRAPLAWTAHRWPALRVISPDGTMAREPVAWLEGRRILTMLGIGQPRRVERHLRAAGALLSVAIAARDHERYDRAKIAHARGLCQGVEAMVVTGKDWVKISPLLQGARERWPVPIVVPELRLEFLSGETELRELVLGGMARR
jgi:tetraacyldisaccharide 4'-kinase